MRQTDPEMERERDTDRERIETDKQRDSEKKCTSNKVRDRV